MKHLELYNIVSSLFTKQTACSKVYVLHLAASNLIGCHLLTLKPAHTVRFWPRFGRMRPILKILKIHNPRLKSVVFDRWFDMFTDSRLMAAAIKFHLR